MTVATVTIAYQARPFQPARRFSFPVTMTITEMVAALPDLPDGFAQLGVVLVNGHEILRASWHRVRILAAAAGRTVITLFAPLENKGGVGAILGLVGTVAVALAAPYLAPILLGEFSAATGLLISAGAYSTVLTATTAAITLGGALAVAGLTAAPSLSPSQAGSGVSQAAGAPSGSIGTASLSANVLSPGGPVPAVIGGPVRVFPPAATQVLIEAVGDDEIAETVYVLAGAHALSAPRSGNVDVADIPELTYQLVDGLPATPIQTLVTRQGFTLAQGLELSGHRFDPTTPTALQTQNDPDSDLPRWHALISRVEPDEIWATVSWPQGLFISDQPGIAAGQAFRMRFRRRNTAAWTNAPEIHFSHNRVGSIARTIRLQWGTLPKAPSIPPAGFGPVYAFKSVPAQIVSPARGGWTADSYFSRGAGGDLLSVATYATTSNVANVELQSDRAILWLDPAVFPPDVYEIEVMRSYVYSGPTFVPATYKVTGTIYDLFGYYDVGLVHSVFTDQSKFLGRVGINRLSSVWNQNPIQSRDFAQIPVRVKNRAIDQFSVLASGFVNDWNGSNWENVTTTTNPAPHLRACYTSTQSADPLPLDLVDVDPLSDNSILYWRDHCNSNGYQVNMVIEGRSGRDVAQAIAACGFAKPRNSEKWGVVIDRDRARDTPAQIFSSRTLADFRFDRPFVKLPDGLRVRWTDIDNDFRESELIIMDPDGPPRTASLLLEDRRYDGLISEAEVRKRALFDMRQGRKRIIFYYGTAAADSVTVKRGSYAGVNHDVISILGGSARVSRVITAAGMIVGLEFDGTIARSPSGTAWSNPGAAWSDYGAAWSDRRVGVMIRSVDGTGLQMVKEVQAFGDETAAVSFVTPFADPGRSVIDVDSLVTCGPLGNEYKKLIVFDVDYTAWPRANLTFVPLAPELFPPQKPFAQYDWPLPRSAPRLNTGFTRNKI